MAAAYDIGAGFSSADAFSVPQSTFAGTVFNFGSAGDIGDDFSGYSQTATAIPTSSASGKGPAGASGPGYVDANPNARTNPILDVATNPTFLIVGGLVLLAAVGAYVYLNKAS